MFFKKNPILQAWCECLTACRRSGRSRLSAVSAGLEQRRSDGGVHRACATIQRRSAVFSLSLCRILLSQNTNRHSSVLFCSLAVLDVWTYVLHLSLSAVFLTDSSTRSLVHVLVLSIQAVRGLPRLRAPGIVPCKE